MYTKTDLIKGIKAIGIHEGDTVLVHSSFKSLGELEDGADTIVSALIDVIGETGTLVFPTLCSNDWENVYKNWHLDAPSDVGYLTNYFRKLPGAMRSNQATHSVAAMGKDAEYITKTHGETGKIPGPYGDTPFAKDSPWEKLYEKDARVLLIGVKPGCVTFRHLAEYRILGKYLDMIKDASEYEDLKNELWLYETWERCGVTNMIFWENARDQLTKIAKSGNIGDAPCLLLTAKKVVDTCQEKIENFDKTWMQPSTADGFYDWVCRVRAASDKSAKA